MQIALCVKEEIDVTGPFRLIEETASLNNQGLVQILNPADLAALALIREAFPRGDAKITAISIGSQSSERILRECVALGADDAFRIWDSSLKNDLITGDNVARILAAAISTFGFDLIVCGSRGISESSGYVGPALAEYLDIAQVCSVSHIENKLESNGLIMHRKLDHGDREVVLCHLPAVITVDEGTMEIPYASFPDVLASERMTIPTKDLASIGLKSSDIKPNVQEKLLNYIPPRPRTKKVAAPDKSLNPMQLMQQMMGGGGAKNSSGVIEGNPETVAAKIVKFLETNGFITS